VLPRGRRRIRVADVVVVGAVGLLLAAGLGALGGRDEPRPTGLVAADPTPTPDPNATDPPRPLVTPNFACVPIAENDVPAPILFVNGREFLGRVNILTWHGAPRPTPSAGSEPPPPAPRIEIRSDVDAFVETGEDACAVAWELALSDPAESIVLDSVDNPSRDPAVASQNRFRPPFWTYRGHDYNLGLRLIFPNVDIHASWPIRILDFQVPRAMLRDGRRELPLVVGCEAVLGLNSGGHEPVQPCTGPVVSGSVPAAPRVAVVAPKAVLKFSLSDFWDVEAFGAACGRIEDLVFTADEGACAVLAYQTSLRSMELEAPAKAGTWTVEIQACAQQTLVDAQNSLCGPWYVAIRVRE
jgi:hypothetical protein